MTDDGLTCSTQLLTCKLQHIMQHGERNEDMRRAGLKKVMKVCQCLSLCTSTNICAVENVGC